MTHPLRLVAVSGGLQRPSKAAALAEHLLALIADEMPCTRLLIELGRLAPDLAGAVRRSELADTVAQALAAVEQADVLVVSTPVFRGAYTGLFKHFFDFVDQHALIGKPVLLAATGGSERHTLMIDHQLRPLFSFFQAHTLPLGVYATDADFEDYRLHGDAAVARSRMAVQQSMPLIAMAARAGIRELEAAVPL